jgi:predicted lactoylglutathione lyase
LKYEQIYLSGNLMSSMNSMNLQSLKIFTIIVSGSIWIISLSASAQASIIEVAGIYSASLSGNTEVPSVNTQASGKATFELSAQAAALGGAAAAASSDNQMFYEINLQNIDEITAAHIHMGGSDENGPVIVTLFDTDIPTSEINGELVSATITAQNLEGPLEGKQISDLVDLFDTGAAAYVNVHTQTNPGGEIRGTIQEG